MSSPIDLLLDEAISSKRLQGVSFIAVDKAGRCLYSGARGHRDFEQTERMTVQTAGWMASMSKMVTSVAAMHAVDQGLVGLDDDLAEVLPELRDQEVLLSFDSATGVADIKNVKGPITLRQLLSHSAGFAYPPFNETLNQWSVANGRAMERFYGDFVSEQSPAKFKVPELLIYAEKERDWVRPMVAQPGIEWHYGPGIDWAGRVIERASGQTLEQYMHDHIWSPLGMENITFHPEKRPSFPPMLKMGKQDGPDSPVTPGESVYPIPAHNEAGGAGLFSNAEDYGKLLGALLKDDCPILGEAAVNELLRPQLTKSSRQSLKGHRDSGLILPEIPKDIPVDHSLCGLYTAADVPGRRSEGSVTWDGMSGANWLIDRSFGIAMVLFVQVLPGTAAKSLWVELEREVYRVIS